MARILIADDNEDQIAMQTRFLETFGHQVDATKSAPEALEHLKLNAPDVIVADLRLPEIADGLALIRGIREAGSEAPLILLSGWPDELYGTPEEQMVTRVVIKGDVRELLKTIDELVLR